MMEYELKTPRLLLRPLRLADAPEVHLYASDPVCTRYMMFLPNETMDDTRAFLQSVEEGWQMQPPRAYEFAVTLNGQVIGAVSVAPDENGTEAEMGWILNPAWHGQGYALEAASAVRDFALHTLRLPRLIAHCDARNAPSYRLMEKLGMQLEDADGTREYPQTGEVFRELTYALNR